MEKYCILHVKKCEKFPKHGNLILAPSYELATMVSTWPFSIWALDLVGMINPNFGKGNKFILVEIEYFTK